MLLTVIFKLPIVPDLLIGIGGPPISPCGNPTSAGVSVGAITLGVMPTSCVGHSVGSSVGVACRATAGVEVGWVVVVAPESQAAVPSTSRRPAANPVSVVLSLFMVKLTTLLQS